MRRFAAGRTKAALKTVQRLFYIFGSYRHKSCVVYVKVSKSRKKTKRRNIVAALGKGAPDYDPLARPDLGTNEYIEGQVCDSDRNDP